MIVNLIFVRCAVSVSIRMGWICRIASVRAVDWVFTIGPEKLLEVRQTVEVGIRESRVGLNIDEYGALGVVLYELVGESRPFDTRDFSWAERVDILRNQVPVRPSIRLKEVDSDSLLEGVDEDLDQVVLKAMEKEPEQRYATVAAFREDCHCFLLGKPIAAKAPTWGYLFKKYFQRNKRLVLSLGLFLSTLISSLLFTTVAWERSENALTRLGKTITTLESVLLANSSLG